MSESSTSAALETLTLSARASFHDPACPLCHLKDRMTLFTEGAYQVVKCRGCQLVYVTPQRTPEALLGDVYSEHYWASPSPKAHGYADYRRDAANYLRSFHRRANVVRRHFDQPGRLLDVGCAAGYFMTVLRDDLGWEVLGVEPSASIARFGRAEYDLDIQETTLEAADLPKHAFDLISFWDVVEHVPDPVATLVRARELLKPGGKIVFETQNVDSLFHKLLGRKWHHFKHAEHLWHFSPATIKVLLDKAGFELVENTWHGAGKYITLDFIAERVGKIHPILSVLASPLKLLGRLPLYINLGDEMVVTARTADPVRR